MGFVICGEFGGLLAVVCGCIICFPLVGFGFGGVSLVVVGLVIFLGIRILWGCYNILSSGSGVGLEFSGVWLVAGGLVWLFGVVGQC